MIAGFVGRRKLNSFLRVVINMALLAISAGCGVKGKPLPPLEPPVIGRGAPSYKRTAEEARPMGTPSPTPERPSR
jgi:hypothetical protein